jgi:hypothetical protein
MVQFCMEDLSGLPGKITFRRYKLVGSLAGFKPELVEISNLLNSTGLIALVIAHTNVVLTVVAK